MWYRARTIRVLAVDKVLVDLDLTFRVHVEQQFTIEGVLPAAPRLRSEAMHAMVVLLGGKRLYLQADYEDPRGQARFFVAERSVSGPYCVDTPYGGAYSVGDVFHALAAKEFDIEWLKGVLNG